MVITSGLPEHLFSVQHTLSVRVRVVRLFSSRILEYCSSLQLSRTSPRVPWKAGTMIEFRTMPRNEPLKSASKVSINAYVMHAWLRHRIQRLALRREIA
jgi:hypothetical protein